MKVTLKSFDDKKFIPFKQQSGNKFRDALRTFRQTTFRRTEIKYEQFPNGESIFIKIGTATAEIKSAGDSVLEVHFNVPNPVFNRLSIACRAIGKKRMAKDYFTAIFNIAMILDKADHASVMYGSLESFMEGCQSLGTV